MGIEALEVIGGRRRWSIDQGDALTLLRELPDECAGLMLTDPPYSSGGAFRGDRMASTSQKYEQTGQALKRAEFTGDNRDQRSFAYWCALWLSEARRVTMPGAIACVWTDWRQLPSTTDAFQSGGWIWRGVAVWDKTEGSRPRKGAFRSQCEYVVWGSNGPIPPLAEDAPCLAGVHRQYLKPSERHHQAAKPVAILADYCRLCRPGGVILDPFAGSGSGGVAALSRGLPYVGFELSPWHAEAARARMEREAAVQGELIALDEAVPVPMDFGPQDAHEAPTIPASDDPPANRPRQESEDLCTPK